MDSQKNFLPEITIKAVILGAVLSIILAAANAYLGLFAGMTISATIPAAVVSLGILKLFRKHNILENNIIKTAASAGESLAAGVIFTLPALVIMGFWKEGFEYWPVTIIALFGGVLGVLFTVPLRRSLIVEDKLQFPEGIATAEVLESGYKGGSGVKFLINSSLVGGLFKFVSTGTGLWPEKIEFAKALALGKNKTLAFFGSNLSPALLSVGYIVGLNIAVLMFIGGALNWLIAIPICSLFTQWPVYGPQHEMAGQAIHAVEFAGQLWSAKTRYIGVGGMLIGGLWTIFKLRGSILKGIKIGLAAYKKAKPGQTAPVIERTEQDMNMKWVLILIVSSVVPLFLLYQFFVRDITVSAPMAVIMILTGFLFSAVAGYMAGIVGSSNNPISGVTIATVLVSAFILLFLMGKGDPAGPAAAVIIGAVVCCAAAIAGDNMQDLKTGYLLKNTPWKQQVSQIIGTVSAAFVMAPVLMLLLSAYGFKGHVSGEGNPNALIAAQANLMASVSQQVFSGELPWLFVFVGFALAIGVIIFDEYLIRTKKPFRTPVLAVAIGVYLPLELEVPILIGGIIAFLVKKFHKKRNTTTEILEQGNKQGLLIASGLITGEALMGILLAIPIVLMRSQTPFRIPLPGTILPNLFLIISIALLLAISVWLYKAALGKNKK